MLSSLHLYNDSRPVIRLAEHIIDSPLGISLNRMHFLVDELQIQNLPVKNNLIQKLNHHVLCGLPSKHQLEHLIIQQVCILKFVRHNIFIKVKQSQFG